MFLRKLLLYVFICLGDPRVGLRDVVPARRSDGAVLRHHRGDHQRPDGRQVLRHFQPLRRRKNKDRLPQMAES